MLVGPLKFHFWGLNMCHLIEERPFFLYLHMSWDALLVEKLCHTAIQHVQAQRFCPKEIPLHLI